MKKLKKTWIVFLAVWLLGTMIYAQTPSSNTKTVTGGLIEDSLVDKLDTGLSGDEIIFFAGYGLSDHKIQAGAGKHFGDALWISLYDGYYFNADTKQKETATSDGFSSDGVNADFTDNSSSASVSGSSNVKNDLAASFYISDKIGGTFYWNIDSSNLQGYSSTNPTGAISDTWGTTTTKTFTESHADGTTSKTEYSALENKKSTNTFGFDFNGVQTPYFLGERNLYVKLNSVSFTKKSRFIDLAYKTTTTKNGSTVDGDSQPSYSGTYDYNTYTPYVEFETGITLPKIKEFITPYFSLIEGFAFSFNDNENSYSYKKLKTNTSDLLEKTSTDFSTDFGEYIDWTDFITPRFDFDFDLGERITLRTRAQVPVAFGRTFYGADNYTTTETTVSTNKNTGDVTSVKTVTKSGSAKEEDIFNTTVTPEFSLGFVYQIVPEIFSLNFGVTALAEL